MHLYSFKVNYGHVKLKREEKRKRSRNKAVKVKKIVKKGKTERCKGFNPISTDCDGVGFLFCVFDEYSSFVLSYLMSVSLCGLDHKHCSALFWLLVLSESCVPFSN